VSAARSRGATAARLASPRPGCPPVAACARGARRLALTLLLLALAGPARAQAPADTSLGRYLQSLRDSTDRYFGRSVAPVDTTGLDSVLAVALTRPEKLRLGGRTWRLEAAPWLGFNRVDGPRYGGSLAAGRTRRLGRLYGDLGYAAGSRTWLGSGQYELSRQRGLYDWTLDLEAGRFTDALDHDNEDDLLPITYALVWGADARRYLRRDGVTTSLGFEHPSWRGRIAYRDELESPLAVTARWNLTHHELTVPDNPAARFGRTRELGYRLATRTPWVPFTAEAEYLTASRRIGSDLDYRRTRLALGGDLPVARWLTLVPQLEWGRLSGEAAPQAAFYLGGPSTLRSLEGGALGGTGLALGRLDLVELPDLLAIAHVPHPAMLPLQAAAFVASGAVWGADPYGGPTAPGVDWPHRGAFRSEAGVSLLYRPGLPNPNQYVQVSWAWPIGPHAQGARISLNYTRGLDLVHPLGGGNDDD
jgi:hypothetical protein